MSTLESEHNPRLLTSMLQLPELVMEALEEDGHTDIETLVLDIGVGNGRFLATAVSDFPNFRVVSLEKNPSLCDYLKKHLEKFKQLSGEISSILEPNGRFLLWDGFLPANGEQETCVTAKTNQASDALDKFIEEYRGKKVIIAQIGDRKYKLSMADLVTYFTKFPYLNSEYWETKREQLYPFLSLDQISSILNEVGLTVTKVRYPQSRNGLKNFLQSYNITGYDLSSFPSVQVMLEAMKH